MTFSARTLAAIAAAMYILAPASHAADAGRSYAVMSLVGNAITVHTIRPGVGIRTESETRTVLPIREQVFDTAALGAADTAIKATQPGAKIVLMLTQDEGLYKAQNAMFAAPGANKDNLDYLFGLLKDRGVSHLLLITKEYDNAHFKVTNGFTGKGTLDGLGFYIDDTLDFRNSDDASASTGMLGPFAYLRVRLIDVRTLAVLKEAKATHSDIVVRPSASPNAMEMWTSMPSQEKIERLQDLIGKALKQAVPEVLAQ